MNQLIIMYLDYKNDFLTVACFAEYYELSEAEALDVIKHGRAAHEAGAAK
jgi:hypothetical protein